MATKNDEDFWKEDDFWNSSSTSTFNFDDDDDSSAIKAATGDVFNPPSDESTVIPIHAIISKECLNIILDDIKSTNEYVVPSPKDTIQKMFHGFKFVLEIYKTIEDKLLLLDAGLDTWDGNIIIAVIIFLRRTLKTNIFLNHLSKRKGAVKHYANYLIAKSNLQELADLYMATGFTSHMKDIYYLLSKDNTNKESLLKKLVQFNIEYSNVLSSADEIWEINENISFITWQIQYRQACNSVIGQLAVFSEKAWQRSNNDDNINELKRQLKVDDFQFEWTIMNVLATLKMWDKLKWTFIKTNRFLRNNAIKSAIKPDLLVNGLSRHKPPSEILEEFLQYVTDSERSLQLAQRLDLHKFVINYYITQRDRLALISYRSRVATRPEELSTINIALQSQEKKWKN